MVPNGSRAIGDKIRVANLLARIHAFIGELVQLLVNWHGAAQLPPPRAIFELAIAQIGNRFFCLSTRAYDIQPHLGNLWSEDMEELRLQGFNTVLESDWKQFPQDGKVFRIDSVKEFDKLGHTAHHPRGAFAYKEQQTGVRTTLLSVEWKVGKSGVVSPVAILEPVVVGEATVSRATLHNIAYIEALDLEIGCAVEVIRSGEIIPRIVRKL